MTVCWADAHNASRCSTSLMGNRSIWRKRRRKRVDDCLQLLIFLEKSARPHHPKFRPYIEPRQLEQSSTRIHACTSKRISSNRWAGTIISELERHLVCSR